ncbi:FKBP-type peptidyl-prolyl cis-trans isomerase [Singulisphaera sp. PoT]|uniref:FKBP-type peptidyl-prolyl cis-trans isomerase n=1 Tax=Singulisphaera sp. PoT TaxID=3411797 RepID=UPI003BF5EF5A
MAMWRGLFLGLVCLGFVGCGEPPQLNPVAPPGTELPPVLPDSEKEPAEALGEQSQSIKTSEANKAEIQKKEPQSLLKPALATKPGETLTTAGGVKYETTKEGTGPEVKLGQRVRVHYTGTLDDGTVFDSSRKRNEPFRFILGVPGAIDGWQEGILGMKIGEQRKLVIPPALGYGDQANGPIPANSTLHFDVELMGVD